LAYGGSAHPGSVGLLSREAGHLAAYGGQCVLIPSALPGAADVLCGESTC
jgi:hypothetical protein